MLCSSNSEWAWEFLLRAREPGAGAGSCGEQKTKPTQHSVAVLRSLGLNPHLLACRSQDPLSPAVRDKLVSNGAWLYHHAQHPSCSMKGRAKQIIFLIISRMKAHSGSPTQAKPLHLTLQALFCQVTPRHVLNMCDVSNIWHVPIMLEAQGAHKSICDILQLGGHDGMDLTGAPLSPKQALISDCLQAHAAHMSDVTS